MTASQKVERIKQLKAAWRKRRGRPGYLEPVNGIDDLVLAIDAVPKEQINQLTL